MKFLILPPEGLMTIDLQPAAIDCSALASNITAVFFDSAAGEGFVSYNDRASIKEPFSDPTPYQPYVNAWCTALEGGIPAGANGSPAVPALTLAQTQAVKGMLIDGIYEEKRLAPFSSDGHSWDASDESFAAMTAALTLPIVPGITDLCNQINANVVTPTNDSISDIEGDLSSISSGGAYGGAYETLTAVGESFANISWLPLGETSAVSLTYAQLSAIVSGILSRRNLEALVRQQKKAAVAVLGTVAAVIGYDATTGW